MAVKPTLSGVKVLVTRPEHQAQTLCEMISQAGGEPIVFPTIKIVSINNDHWQTFDLKTLDLMIFVSSNAVFNFMSGFEGALPPHLALLAVGKKTAEAMASFELTVDIKPSMQFGSESLLMLPELRDVAGKNIAIVRGKDGRELLADTLSDRGANVTYVDVYQRILPSVSSVKCKQALTCDCVVVTSISGVKNLKSLLEQRFNILLDKPLIVVSDRIRDYAMSLGFRYVTVTTDISDNDILAQLIKMDS